MFLFLFGRVEFLLLLAEILDHRIIVIILIDEVLVAFSNVLSWTKEIFIKDIIDQQFVVRVLQNLSLVGFSKLISLDLLE